MSITDRQRVEAEEHRPDDHGPDTCGDPECFPSCLECGQDWPCATAALLAEVDRLTAPPADDEVEAVALALYCQDDPPHHPSEWACERASEREHHRRTARLAIEAAREAQR